MRLEERVYYQALLDTFMYAVQSRLVAPAVAFGYRPRGSRNSTKPFGGPIDQWLEFRRAVKDAARSGLYDAVVNTDITAFFEHVQHQRLEDQLLALGVRKDVAAEVRSLLGRLMGGEGRGLPQGCDPSSVLSTLYLDPVDKAMKRWGYTYFRYVDDIYIFAPTESEGRVSLHRLEAEVRALGLNLQSGKTHMIVGTGAIRREVIEADDEIQAVDYVVKRVNVGAQRRVRKEWSSVSRRRPWPPRFVKYLIRRLAGNRDELAVGWCLSRLGTIDWLGVKGQRDFLLGGQLGSICADT